MENYPKLRKVLKKWEKLPKIGKVPKNGEKFPKMEKVPEMDKKFPKLKKVPEIEETKLNLYQRQMPQHKVLFRRGAALKFSLR